MCGRYVFLPDRAYLAAKFGQKGQLKPVFNAAPGQELAVILKPEQPEIKFMKWGLVPNWAKPAMKLPPSINARCETIFDKPSFNRLLDSKRCLVLSTGFVEWKKEGKNKIPYWIQVEGEPNTFFGGLWDIWENPETKEKIETFTIITTEANAAIKPYHNRMPLILPNATEMDWLETGLSADKLKAMMKPIDPDLIKVKRLDILINSVANQGPEVLEGPKDGLGQLGLW